MHLKPVLTDKAGRTNFSVAVYASRRWTAIDWGMTTWQEAYAVMVKRSDDYPPGTRFRITERGMVTRHSVFECQ